MTVGKHELIDRRTVKHDVPHDERPQPRVGRVDRPGGRTVQALQQIIDVPVLHRHAGAQHVVGIRHDLRAGTLNVCMRSTRRDEHGTALIQRNRVHHQQRQHTGVIGKSPRRSNRIIERHPGLRRCHRSPRMHQRLQQSRRLIAVRGNRGMEGSKSPHIGSRPHHGRKRHAGISLRKISRFQMLMMPRVASQRMFHAAGQRMIDGMQVPQGKGTRREPDRGLERSQRHDHLAFLVHVLERTQRRIQRNARDVLGIEAGTSLETNRMHLHRQRNPRGNHFEQVRQYRTETFGTSRAFLMTAEPHLGQRLTVRR